MYQRKFLQQYRDYLSQFTDLRDCAFKNRLDKKTGERIPFDSFMDSEREELRKHPKEPYVERDRRGRRHPRKIFRDEFKPPLYELDAHLVKEDILTIFVRNTIQKNKPILMLLDVDNKDGSGNPDAAVKEFSEKYPLGSFYCEPSSNYLGRHIYFFLDVTLSEFRWNEERTDIWEAFDDLKKILVADPLWARHGVSVNDGFYGMPTVWGMKFGDRGIVKRGNCLKLPRCLNGQADLDSLKSLKSVKLENLLAWISAHKDSPIGRDASVRTDLRERETAIVAISTVGMDGNQKKVRCIGALLRKAGDAYESVTTQEAHDDYMGNWNPTTEGDTPAKTKKRWKSVEKILSKMKRSFRPFEKKDTRKYPFRRNQFTSIIHSIVPQSEYEWTAPDRSTINAQKLSDFISIMIANSFYKGKTLHFAQTSQDTTISNSRKLKSQGKIDWVLTWRTYKKLLELSVKYSLLQITKTHRPPTIDVATKKKENGVARQVAPGTAFRDVREEWMVIYREWAKYLPEEQKIAA